jgi:hypothetical protein
MNNILWARGKLEKELLRDLRHVVGFVFNKILDSLLVVGVKK